MNKTYTVIIGMLVVFAVGTTLFFSRPPRALNVQPVATSSIAAIAEQVAARVVPEGMREYRNAAYHFSLLYPQELTVAEHAEGGGATTVTFQNVERAEGFQIFIVPYSEAQVSEERFRQDEPSGVRKNLTNIVVDGATGAAFYSANPALGDTREVWFVRNGFLYEATTLKPLEAWFRDILQTWKWRVKASP